MDQATLIQEALTTAQTVLVTLPSQLTLDKVASALALYLSLRKIPQNVTIACEKAMTVEYSSLVGVDKVANKLGGRNLVVSFDYKEDSIEKVSYNIENDQFNLVIRPKEGMAPLATDKVKYRYAGGGADLVINVGGESLAELGKLYQDNKEALDKAKTVNLSLGQAASYSEQVAEILSKLRLPVDEDIAGNLLAGLKDATNNFTAANLSANTFEAAAFCLRSGAELNKKKSGDGFELGERDKKEEVGIERKDIGEAAVRPQPDWFEPKIYRGNIQA
ncbi:MAG: hypothetical protein ABH807_00910 [Candidatus Shapirobacteria bacterium]